MEIVMALKPNLSDELKAALLEVEIARAEFYAMLKANPVLKREWQRHVEQAVHYASIGKPPH
jgi:hypothetical protein